MESRDLFLELYLVSRSLDSLENSLRQQDNEKIIVLYREWILEKLIELEEIVTLLKKDFINGENK